MSLRYETRDCEAERWYVDRRGYVRCARCRIEGCTEHERTDVETTDDPVCCEVCGATDSVIMHKATVCIEYFQCKIF